MTSNGDLWMNGAGGVLRNGSSSTETPGRRRTKSGPKRVTFKLESDSPPKDGAGSAEADTVDGMPSWWPRPAAAETTARTVENSPLVTSRPPPAVVVSPPAPHDFDPSPQASFRPSPVAAGVYYPNGETSARVSSPVPVGNGHRDAVSPPPPITVQNRGPPPIGSPDRTEVASPPPISNQSRALSPTGTPDSFVISTNPPVGSLRLQPAPVGVVDETIPSASAPITASVTALPSNQKTAPERTMPSWWPKQPPAVRPPVAEVRRSWEARPASPPQPRVLPEPEYYDNTSPEWQARNTATTQSVVSRVLEPATRGSTVASPPPLPARPCERTPPVPPVPSSRPSPHPSSGQQVARVVTQSNQSFLQSAKDVAGLAPPLPTPPPDADFTHPSEEDFWHLSPRPGRRLPPTPDDHVAGRPVTSEATQTAVEPRPEVDDAWSRLMDVLADEGQESGLRSRYRDTLMRRPEMETVSPAQQEWQQHERLARQRQELEELEQRRRQQQHEEEQRRREQQLLTQREDEERRRLEQQQFLHKQEEERRLFEERQLLEKRDEERRRQEEQQWLQKQQEEKRREEQGRILQQQAEERQRLEQQRILQQQEEDRRRALQEQEDEQRKFEHQQYLQRQEDERRRRQHEELLQRQDEERRRKRQEEEDERRHDQIRLQREQEEEQRQLELQEQLQRELRNQHQQQQWRQVQAQQQERRQWELQQQQQQVEQQRQQVVQQQQRLAADWRRGENAPPADAAGLLRNVSLRESSRSVDLARRAGRVWDEDGDWVGRQLDERANTRSPASGGSSDQSAGHTRRESELRMMSTARPVTDGAMSPRGVATSWETSGRRDEFIARPGSATSSRREVSLVRDAPAPNAGENQHRSSDNRLENDQRRASFQQSFMSPPPGGYTSPTSSTKSDPGSSRAVDEKDSGRSSPNPLDDELEICLKSVEEAMASLQDTVQKNNYQRETGAAATRPDLNRSFEVAPPGSRASGDWRRRSCDSAELERYSSARSWNQQRGEHTWSDHEDRVTKDERSWGVLRPLQHNACHLWTAAENNSSNWTRLVIGDWLLGSPDNRNDVVSRRIALWEGRPADSREDPGPGQSPRRICGPTERAYTPQRAYRQLAGPESEEQGDEVGSQISRIGMESRQKHRHITERMMPTSPSPSPSGTSYDSWRSSSQTPTPSPWQQSSASPLQSQQEPWQSGPVRQSPSGPTGQDWNSRHVARLSSSEQPASPWQQSPPREFPWSAGVTNQTRRANTLAETRGGYGFGRRPALNAYQSQSATLPAGQPRPPAAWCAAQSPGSAQGSPVGSQMAAPAGHWAAPLSPSGSVTSMDWNQLFETSSEQSSCMDDELSSVSGDWSRPHSREEVVRWYQQHQLPRGVGVDALSGRAAPWFHGLVSRPDAEQRLLPCPPGAYLVRCSQRIWGYTLSYRSQKRCKHFLIEASDDGYRFYGNPDRLFRTLDELLRHHTIQPITAQGGELLRFPCGNMTSIPAGQLVM